MPWGGGWGGVWGRWQDANRLQDWKDVTKYKAWTMCDRILVLKGNYKICFYSVGTSECGLDTRWYWNCVTFLGDNNVFISYRAVHFVSRSVWVQLLVKTCQLWLLPLNARPCVKSVLCMVCPVAQVCILFAGCVATENLLNLSVPYL